MPKTQQYPEISVICPFYNEASIIEASILRTIKNLNRDFGTKWELILVNDGSTDDSVAEIIKAINDSKAQNTACPTIKIIGAPFNQGRGRALKYGIDAANAPIIVTTEADCSWGDDIAKRLYDELSKNDQLDFVIASPHRKGGGLVNVSTNRAMLTKLGNVFIRSFFQSDITMNTGMTRAYRADVIQPLMTTQNGKEFHLEVLLKLITLGFKASEIPATIEWQDHKLQKSGTKKRVSTTRIFKTIFTHLQFVAIAQPMKYFTAWAALFMLLSGGFTLWAAINLFIPTQPSVFVAIMGFASFIISLMLGGFAVLFTHLRDIMKDQWMRHYNNASAHPKDLDYSSTPPSIRPAIILYDSNAKPSAAPNPSTKNKGKAK